MEKIIIESNDLVGKGYLGVGGESIVYPYFDNGKLVAIKKFIKPKNIQNKIKKIVELEKMKNNNNLLVLPQKLVELDGIIQGYSMEHLIITNDSEDFITKKRRIKIDLLKRLKSIVELLNNNNLLYFDYDNGNVIIDNLGKMRLIDLDNCKTKDTRFDVVTCLHKLAEQRKIPLDEQYNKYVFNIYTMSLLSKKELKYLVSEIEDHIFEYNTKSKEEKMILNYTNRITNEYNTDFIIDIIT